MYRQRFSDEYGKPAEHKADIIGQALRRFDDAHRRQVFRVFMAGNGLVEV